MAFTGEREFIMNHLDYLWELLNEIALEAEKASPDQLEALSKRREKIREDYDFYFQRLGELPPRW